MTAVSDFNGVEVYDAFDIDDEVRVEISGEWRWLKRVDVRELRDHLNTLLGDAPAAKAETVAVEVGREYRLLPGARHSVMRGEVWEGQGVTRIGVEYGPDGDGDYRVRALDGGASGDTAYVMPKYLAPLDAPAAETESVVRGREYRLLPGSKYVDGTDCVFVDDHTTRVRVLRGRNSDGDVYVKAIDGDNPGYSAHVDPKYLAPLDEEPAKPSPDVAQAARTVAGEAEQAHQYVTARWFREFADLLEGKSL